MRKYARKKKKLKTVETGGTAKKNKINKNKNDIKGEEEDKKKKNRTKAATIKKKKASPTETKQQLH